MHTAFRNPRAYIFVLSALVIGLMLIGPTSREANTSIRPARCDAAACASSSPPNAAADALR
jgi:hypothetical protein